MLVSNSRASDGALNEPALWRSGTKVTSVAILLVRTAYRQQRTGTSIAILAPAAVHGPIVAVALRMLDMAYMAVYGLYSP